MSQEDQAATEIIQPPQGPIDPAAAPPPPTPPEPAVQAQQDPAPTDPPPPPPPAPNPPPESEPEPAPEPATDEAEAQAAEAGPAEAPNKFLEMAHGRGRVWSDEEHFIVEGAAHTFHRLQQGMEGLAIKTGRTHHLEAALKALHQAYDGLLGHLVTTSSTVQEKPAEPPPTA